LFVFFFQAEDGIRDRNVTGVQTCALPISSEAAKEILRLAIIVRAWLPQPVGNLLAKFLNGLIFLSIRATSATCCKPVERFECLIKVAANQKLIVAKGSLVASAQ